MSRQNDIKNFVKDILGCSCPDKVFEHIVDRQVAPSSLPHTRIITVDNRLLIYIWIITGADTLKENLIAMLEAGRNERDARGLNRFRAVVAVDDTTRYVAAEAVLYFSQYAGKDERIHLHVVPFNALPK